MRAMRQSLPDLTPPSPLLETLFMNKFRENYVHCLTPYSTLYSLEVAIRAGSPSNHSYWLSIILIGCLNLPCTQNKIL